jgi:pimeloyl-ACP methyl ester carboxylesterase
MNIVYIHGNRASTDSFNFIRTQLPGYKEVLLEYDGADGFYNNHANMRAALEGLDDIFFIGHSLGGIHALHLANELADRVLGGVTLSTPYGGSEAAEVVKYILPFDQVLKDIHPRSGPIVASKNFDILHPWTNVVSMKGHSAFMLSANDGVVTQKSMRHRDDINLVDVDSNHFEILLSRATVDIILQTIGELESGLTRKIVVCGWGS